MVNPTVIQAGMHYGTMSLIFILILLVFCGLSTFGTFMFLKRRAAQGIQNIPKSPVFDSFPNEYTSLPTKDVSTFYKKFNFQNLF